MAGGVPAQTGVPASSMRSAPQAYQALVDALSDPVPRDHRDPSGEVVAYAEPTE